MSQKVVLIYNGTTVTLTHPEMENVDKVEHYRINRETRGGTKIIFRDPMWPITETLNFRFEDLSQNQVKQYLDFLELSLAQVITLVDHMGDEWEGIIINPDAEVQQTKRSNGDNCGGFAFELNFQGNKV